MNFSTEVWGVDNMSLTREEREMIIRFDEAEEMATIYTRSRPWQTKLSKLAKTNKNYKQINKDAESVTYEFPKKLITLRSKTVKKELTEEQRQKLSERMSQNRFKAEKHG